MGTRGAYGFHKHGVTKATYNHYDSYPSYLGVNVANFILETPTTELNDIFNKIVMVDSNSKPTKEQINQCIKYFDNNVSTGSTDEWYALLRNSQGDLNAYKNGLIFMIDGGQHFIKDSLFCEWAYIINLDTNTLEVYEGFQKEIDYNRYYDDRLLSKEYKNCKLICDIPFEELSRFEDIVTSVISSDD